MDIYSPPILYISSDEESAFRDSIKYGNTTAESGGFYDREDHDWLSELLGEVDRKTLEDDCDEVVFVSEVIPTPKRSRLKRLGASDEMAIVTTRNDQDDDCVILEVDPDETRATKKGRIHSPDETRATKKGRIHSPDGDINDDSSDVEIVGEKGEVACRDFPHSRHLCANFAFDSTPHEVHCSQCHCYVCDSVAPCAHWGSGKSSSDHCHASEKENFWRSERERLRKGGEPVPLLPGIADGTLSEGHPQVNQLPTPFPLPLDSLPKNPCSRPVAVHPYSKSTSTRVPDFLNFRRNHLVGRAVRPQFVSRSLSNNRPPSFTSPGYVSASPYDRNGYYRRHHSSKLPRDPSLKRCHSRPTHVSNGSHGFSQISNFVTHRPEFPTLQSMMNTSSQLPMAYPPHGNNSFPNVILLHSPVASPSNPVNLEDMFLPQLDKPDSTSEQPDLGSGFEDQMYPTSMKPYSQNLSYSMPTSSMINNQPGFQQTQVSSSEFDVSHWRIPPPEVSLQQSTVQVGLSMSAKDQTIEATGVLDGLTAITNPDSLNFEFEDWNFENPSFAGALEVNPLSPNSSVFSAEHDLHTISQFDL